MGSHIRIGLAGVLSVVALGFLASDFAAARRTDKKIKIHSELKTELNAVLKSTADLQEASFKGKDQKALKEMRTLIKRMNSALKRSHLAKEQRLHVQKILERAKGLLEKARRTAGSDRQTHLQGALRQIVNLAQAYQLDKYKVFFCPKDKSIWLQRSSKPQNPVNPGTYGKCGKPVP